RVPGHPDPALDAPRAVEVRPETAHPAHAARGERLDVVRLDTAARAAVLGARARPRPLADDEPHAAHSAHPRQSQSSSSTGGPSSSNRSRSRAGTADRRGSPTGGTTGRSVSSRRRVTTGPPGSRRPASSTPPAPSELVARDLDRRRSLGPPRLVRGLAERVLRVLAHADLEPVAAVRRAGGTPGPPGSRRPASSTPPAPGAEAPGACPVAIRTRRPRSRSPAQPWSTAPGTWPG